MVKICLVSSSGGHYEQITRLAPLINEYSGFFVTEKTPINNKANYYLLQVNRKQISSIPKILVNCFISLRIMFREKPNIIISTGALCTVPMCIIGRLLNKKIIFIESFAKVNSPTLTGKLIYKISDLFIVQWEQMKDYYPEAIFGGGIY